jgi:hypothetical protein
MAQLVVLGLFVKLMQLLLGFQQLLQVIGHMVVVVVVVAVAFSS